MKLDAASLMVIAFLMGLSTGIRSCQKPVKIIYTNRSTLVDTNMPQVDGAPPRHEAIDL